MLNLTFVYANNRELTGESVNVPIETICIRSQGLFPQVLSTMVEAGGSVLESEDLLVVLIPHPTPII